MITEKDVYIAFKKAEAKFHNKQLRLTKDWGSYSKRSISQTDMAYLSRITDYFNTIWNNINIDMYMDTGFEIYENSGRKCPECGCILFKPFDKFYECMECGLDTRKGFTYNKLLRPKILNQYIENDKIRKRNQSPDKTKIEETFKFIQEFMKGKPMIDGYTVLQSYCKRRDGQAKWIVKHYLRNKIDQLTFVYCIYHKYIILTDIERQGCYNVVNRYRELTEKMLQLEDFIKGWEK